MHLPSQTRELAGVALTSMTSTIRGEEALQGGCRASDQTGGGVNTAGSYTAHEFRSTWPFNFPLFQGSLPTMCRIKCRGFLVRGKMLG